jgi:HK97 gp10 family phage protein
MAGDDFDANLARLPAAVKAQVAQAMFKAGQFVQVEAQISITDGATSGKNHTPSPPGSAPNNDTAFLANNIETVQVEPLKVEISSNAPYSRPLEFGTSRMEARPFMGPAAYRSRDKITKYLAREVAKAMRGTFKGI